MNEKELIHVKSMCRFFFCLCLDKIKTRFLLSQGYILISWIVVFRIYFQRKFFVILDGMKNKKRLYTKHSDNESYPWAHLLGRLPPEVQDVTIKKEHGLGIMSGTPVRGCTCKEMSSVSFWNLQYNERGTVPGAGRIDPASSLGSSPFLKSSKGLGLSATRFQGDALGGRRGV